MSDLLERIYSEADLRDAFRAGWKERNASPGLKLETRRSINNHILGAIGGGRYAEKRLVPDDRTYRHAIWLRSDFFQTLRPRGSKAGERK